LPEALVSEGFAVLLQVWRQMKARISPEIDAAYGQFSVPIMRSVRIDPRNGEDELEIGLSQLAWSQELRTGR
jgi:hypothetical protein